MNIPISTKKYEWTGENITLNSSGELNPEDKHQNWVTIILFCLCQYSTAVFIYSKKPPTEEDWKKCKKFTRFIVILRDIFDGNLEIMELKHKIKLLETKAGKFDVPDFIKTAKSNWNINQVAYENSEIVVNLMLKKLKERLTIEEMSRIEKTKIIKSFRTQFCSKWSHRIVGTRQVQLEQILNQLLSPNLFRQELWKTFGSFGTVHPS